MKRKYLGRTTGAVATATGLGLILAGAPVAAATSADTVQPPAIRDSAVKPPPAWATSAEPMIAVAGVKGSSVSKQGSGLKVTLAKPRTGVYTRAAGTSSHYRTKALVKRWRKQVGAGSKGNLAGTTTGGQQVSLPVVFGTPKATKKGRIIVVATPRGGDVPALVKKYLKIDGVAAGSTEGKFSSLSAVAQGASSKMWQFGNAAASAKVTKSGATYTIQLSPGAGGSGVQPNGQAARVAWADLVAGKAKLAKGARARLVVTGRGAKGKSVAEAFRPTDYAFSGGNLTITAKAGSPLTKRDRKSIKSMKSAAVSLLVSNPANTRSYVVITGDSISSGESGRYANGYYGQPFNEGESPGDGQRGLCALVDLACIGVTTEEVDGVTKWNYNYDLSRVYEKGTQPVSDGGNGCNRSLYAPGTWLTNYFAEEKGADIGTINLACSGAKTENVKFAANGGKDFKGEGPQADRLKKLTTWLPVPYVTNTMGANDIRFADIAMACFIAPAEALGFDISIPMRNAKPNTREFSVTDLIDLIPGIVEAGWNPAYNSSVECNKKFGGLIDPARGVLAENYRNALGDLLAAAPNSQIVAMNYPNLISDSEQSDLNRKGAFEILESPMFQNTIGVLPSVWDPPLPAEEVLALISQGAVADEAIVSAILSILGQQVVLSADSILGTANLLFSSDADWAANTVIPAIDDTIYDAAGKLGSRVIPVDQRELFNGRQMASRYATSDEEEVDAVVASAGSGPSWLRMSIIKDNGKPIFPAQKVRTSFVTAPFPGLPLPVACPEQSDISLNGAGFGEPGAQCIGSMQEALHPNLRGQAAQGQCLVAVVTGMLGKGNSCVRSVGSNEFSTKPTTDKGLPNWVAVQGDDTLCVNAAPKRNYDDDPSPSKCSGKILADPLWSQQQWSKIWRTNVTIPETTTTVQRQAR